MFLIFNLSGLLIGLAGVLVGGVAIVNGFVWLGLLLLALVWFVVGRWWRDGGLRPYPSLFFIPVQFLAIPIAVLGLLGVVFVTARTPDARRDQFEADRKTIGDARATGDTSLSRTVLTALESIVPREARPEEYRVFTRHAQNHVLLLLKVGNLKSFTDTARTRLIARIVDVLEGDPRSRGQEAYVALMGAISTGAVRVPSGRVTLEGLSKDTLLYPFYAAEPRPAR